MLEFATGFDCSMPEPHAIIVGQNWLQMECVDWHYSPRPNNATYTVESKPHSSQDRLPGEMKQQVLDLKVAHRFPRFHGRARDVRVQDCVVEGEKSGRVNMTILEQ